MFYLISERFIDRELMVSHSFNKNAPVSNAVLEPNVNRGDLFDGSDDIPAASDAERVYSFSNADNNGSNESLKDGSNSPSIARENNNAWRNDSQQSIVGSNDTSSVEITQV